MPPGRLALAAAGVCVHLPLPHPVQGLRHMVHRFIQDTKHRNSPLPPVMRICSVTRREVGNWEPGPVAAVSFPWSSSQGSNLGYPRVPSSLSASFFLLTAADFSCSMAFASSQNYLLVASTQGRVRCILPGCPAFELSKRA